MLKIGKTQSQYLPMAATDKFPQSPCDEGQFH
ncbi:hypothetical protein FVEN_g13089 [Fusarium venenatum]|nr:hypothetical protein FVEN_g13089 [Fusarium venenatum]